MFALVSSLSTILLVTTLLSCSEAAVRRDTASVVKARYGGFKDNCFPMPSGGCSCSIKDVAGIESVKQYNKDEDCRIPAGAVETMLNKGLLNEEIKERYGSFKENCFPRPSGGCKCNEVNAAKQEVVKSYNTDAECKVPKKNKRATTSQVSQNVRDPIREKAQQNYAAVIDELNQKFKNLREGCFPRPKGCLCVIGKDRDGREITERRMKDEDCKCKAGERGNGCPAAGA